MSDWNEEKRKAGFWPTPFLRFIERYVPELEDGLQVLKKRRILQQKWNEIMTGKDGVWYDVTFAEDETESGDPLGR